MISIEQEANQLTISLLFGYEQVAKRIANIRLTIYRMKRKENKKYGYRGIKK